MLEHACLAITVQKVSTRRSGCRDDGTMNIFHTDRTVGLGSIFDAFVTHILLETEAASETMDKVVSSTNPTNPASVAVKLLLILVIVEAADGAEISFSEHSFAVCAGSRDGLAQIALAAHDLLHGLPVQAVGFLHRGRALGLVVADPAAIDLVTARSH